LAILWTKYLRAPNPAIAHRATDQFDFVVNLKTAKALGIKIPDVIMLRATKVIE
jgi:ABC-type uncharacterized transport system substrate-binding protein